MAKSVHEVRDPIHTFIRYGSTERLAIDSAPVQRLRHIHQLALTYFVYPGASHKRFEHSLGVMELAGRVFDVITSADAVNASGELVRDVLSQLTDTNKDTLRYWRQVLRLAALLHDVGHLPFSHAAEKDLLPEGWDHERLTREIILTPSFQACLADVRPKPEPMDIVKLAIGPDKASDLTFTTWENILYEIIGGDAFGVDRMDYLLRDSYHTGVAYGRFDHFRLIDSLRILPSPPTKPDGEPGEPALGVEIGGLQSAESLLMARYLMYSQVYFHRVRLIYNLHLQEFLSAWLAEHRFPTDVSTHLAHDDNEVLHAIAEAARADDHPGHDPAKRIVERRHFRTLYQSSGAEGSGFVDRGNRLFAAAEREFGSASVRSYHYDGARDRVLDFPVRDHDGNSVSATAISQVLNQVPAVRGYCIFVDPDLRQRALQWLAHHRARE